MIFELSEDQQHILDNYQGGYASVLATPGAGKTTLISYLIKNLIFNKQVKPKSILVLTLTESASNEFKERTVSLLGKAFPSPEFLTIHSFCKKVLDNFSSKYADLNVLTEPERHAFFENILNEKGLPKFNPEETGDFDYAEIFKNYVIPIHRRNNQLVNTLKDNLENDKKNIMQVTKISNRHFKYLYLIPEIVHDYETFLTENKKIDFDMMITETLKILKNDNETLNSIKNKYEYILEDEAQDSNEIQGEILKLIAGDNGNYIRVGDPNQSIFTTFTGADYKGLIDFYNTYQKYEIKQSNRSFKDIINLSNELVRNFKESFPAEKVKIVKGHHNPKHGSIQFEEFTDVEDECLYIAKNFENILNKNKKSTFAVLTRTNNQVKEIYNSLINQGYPCILHNNKEDDFFKNETVKKIAFIVYYILNPNNFNAFVELLKKLQIEEEYIEEFFNEEDSFKDTFKAIAQDQLIYFGDEVVFEKISTACKKLYKLIDCIYKPVTEVLQVINNYFIEDIKEKNILSLVNMMWTRIASSKTDLSDFYTWLRKYMDVKISQEINFAREDFSAPNTIHLLTIHKAKGLQWDTVFLPHFTSIDFKDNEWKGFNADSDFKSIIFSVYQHLDVNKIREKVLKAEIQEGRRVAYVGITRAKKNLFITSADRAFNGKKREPSEIFYLLKNFQNSNK